MRRAKRGRIPALLALAGLWLWGAPPCVLHAGESGAAFLTIPSSPRALALGQSEAVSAVGAQAVDANPANLGLLGQRYELFSSYASLPQGAEYEHIAAAFGSPAILPDFLPLEALGLAVTHYGVGGIPVADSQGNQTGGTFSSGDLAVALSGSGKLAPGLRLGLTAKVVQSQIAGYRSNLALASDIGLTYAVTQLAQSFNVGLSVTNLGQGLRFIGQTDPLPSTAGLGVSVPLGPATVVVEVDRLLHDQGTQVGAGLEWGLGPVSFRGGYLSQNPGPSLGSSVGGAAGLFSGLSFGLGVRAGSARLDYAVSQQAPQLGSAQHLALTLQWGGAGGSHP